MVSIPIVVNVAGMPDVLSRVRGEVAAAIRQVAASETDMRVAARLMEISAMVQQELSHAEAVQVVANPTVHKERRPGLTQLVGRPLDDNGSIELKVVKK